MTTAPRTRFDHTLVQPPETGLDRLVRWAVLLLALTWVRSAGAEVRIEGLSGRPPDRISIFTVRGEGISTPLISFQEKARQEVEAHLHAQVVSMAEMFTRGDLSFSAMADCRGDADCFADLIGAAVDARYLLVITASLIADSKLVGARLIDLEKRAVVGESLGEVEGAFAEAVPARIREAVPEDWWDPFGSLAIEASTPGVQLTVNGRVVGMSPIDELAYLLPGTYRVEGTKQGFLAAAQMVTVARGEKAKVSLMLEPEPEPASSLWILWVGIGAAVVAGGAVTAAVLLRSGDDGPASFCTAPGGAGCP